MSTAPLKVVLCWHMHQPDYRDALDGHYHQPWTYLHAIKDYADMAAHLEQVPAACAVVNFAPTLLEQLSDYSERLAAHFSRGVPLGDSVLATLTGEFPADEDGRRQLLRALLRANEKRLIARFPPLAKLVVTAKSLLDHELSASYVSDQFLRDLAVWYHLAWMGETVRRDHALVQQLATQAVNFTTAQSRALLVLIGDVLDSIVPRYRKLANTGRVELSVTPYAHPMLPLLLDFDSAREAMPNVAMPVAPGYPNGDVRAHWHLREGVRVFEHYFGFRPQGCWPSEGGVSSETLALIAEHGFRWVATGESVLRNTLKITNGSHAAEEKTWLHRGYRFAETDMGCFFRDDGLSDLIGFTYADWHAEDAVANLIGHLRTIAKVEPNNGDRVVSIILDGENAWEYYPENGYHFLSTLYSELANHPEIELTTFGALMGQGVDLQPLASVVAGSWVYGTFSTWIGDAGKNRGWDLLVAAKRVYDEFASAEPAPELVRQLGVCEGSDWFWWFGDYNPAEAVSDFDDLYRGHLKALYRALGQAVPAQLNEPISSGSGVPEAGGVMRRGQA